MPTIMLKEIIRYDISQKDSQAPGHEQLSAATKILKLDYNQTSLRHIQHARALLEQAVELGNKDAIRILADLLFVHISHLIFNTQLCYSLEEGLNQSLRRQ